MFWWVGPPVKSVLGFGLVLWEDRGESGGLECLFSDLRAVRHPGAIARPRATSRGPCDILDPIVADLAFKMPPLATRSEAGRVGMPSDGHRRVGANRVAFT